jgi:hypothetical protein
MKRATSETGRAMRRILRGSRKADEALMAEFYGEE